MIQVVELDAKGHTLEQAVSRLGHDKKVPAARQEAVKSVYQLSVFIWMVTHIQRGVAGHAHIIKYLQWRKQ